MKDEDLDSLANLFSQTSSTTDTDTAGELTQEDRGLQWYFLTHSTLIIGYGVDDGGEKFWIVRNSYGPAWGEDGHFRIRRG